MIVVFEIYLFIYAMVFFKGSTPPFSRLRYKSILTEGTIVSLIESESVSNEYYENDVHRVIYSFNVPEGLNSRQQRNIKK
jgi:hypothetical protein